MARTPATGLRVSVESAAELRRLALNLSAKLGRRVTMSDALTVAARVASADLDATAALLTGEDTAR
jgi:hypothetical protein